MIYNKKFVKLNTFLCNLKSQATWRFKYFFMVLDTISNFFSENTWLKWGLKRLVLLSWTCWRGHYPKTFLIFISYSICECANVLDGKIEDTPIESRRGSPDSQGAGGYAHFYIVINRRFLRPTPGDNNVSISLLNKKPIQL